MPLEYGSGMFSARAWVNQNASPRKYFGDIQDGIIPISDPDNAAIELCGVIDSANPNEVDSNLSGYFDVLNFFLWFQGSQNLWASPTSKVPFAECDSYLSL